MPIRLLFRKPKKAVMIGIAVLSAALFLAPIHADASTYTQHITVFDISIINTWSADADPMPVDITMSYSGSFELGYMNAADADSLPETIQIYYDGEYCGDAVKTSVSNAERKTRVYDYSVSVPFRFSSYDTATKSATIDFASGLVEYSFGDNTLNTANHFYNGEYHVSEKALIDLDAIENSQITESSANGVRYAYTVSRSRSTTTEYFGGGQNQDSKTTHTITISVTNTTKPAGSLGLTARKTVNGGAPDQSYTFCLLDADGNILQTKQNDTDGGIQFDPITYSASDVGTEFTYQVAEQAGTDENTTYDGTVYTISVTPYQDQDDLSKIIVDPTVTVDGTEAAAIVFNNTVDDREDIIEPTEDNTQDNTQDTAPNTGDGTEPAIWAAAAAAACGIGLKLRFKSGRTREKRE